jgi:D-3-phosphoglycerate dehydrogenase
MTTSVSRPLVVVVDTGYDSYDVEREILRPFNAEVVLRPCDGDVRLIDEAVAQADAILVRESPIRRETINMMTRCKAIVRYGIGIDNIDLEAARDRRIYVANVPDYGSEEVSDHALALLLSVVRRTVSRDRAVRSGAWNVSRTEKMYRIAGCTMGFVGFGRIARALHRKMQGFNLGRVLAYDPLLSADPLPGIERVDLDQLCREADFISIHAPLTRESRHVIDASRLKAMKPTAILINTSRGPLVDEAALVDALRGGWIRGAGVDVFEQEPPDPNNPLFSLDNVVLSDHTAWYSEGSVLELQTKAAQEVARIFAGEKPRSWVNAW